MQERHRGGEREKFPAGWQSHAAAAGYRISCSVCERSEPIHLVGGINRGPALPIHRERQAIRSGRKRRMVRPARGNQQGAQTGSVLNHLHRHRRPHVAGDERPEDDTEIRRYESECAAGQVAECRRDD